MTAYLATTLATGTGSSQDITLSWDYLGKASWSGSNSNQIVVEIGDSVSTIAVSTSWTMPNSSTVRLTTSNNKYIRVRRDSHMETLRLDFADGSRLTGDQLDLMYQHAIYSAQENNDRITYILDTVNQVTAGGTVNLLSIPLDGSVTTAKIASGAVTLPKIDFSASGSNGQPLFKRSGVAVFSTILAADIPDLLDTIAGFKLNNLQPPGGDIDMANNAITGLTDPANDQDAATKKYVDDAIDSINVAQADGGRVVSGQITVGSSFGELNLGWQPDSILIFPDYGTSGGVRGISPTNRYNDATPADVGYEPIVQPGAHGDTLQTWQVAATGSQGQIKIQRRPTGFKYKLFSFDGTAGVGTQVCTYIAVRNSTIS